MNVTHIFSLATLASQRAQPSGLHLCSRFRNMFSSSLGLPLGRGSLAAENSRPGTLRRQSSPYLVHERTDLFHFRMPSSALNIGGAVTRD